MLNNFKWYRALRGGLWYKHIRESYTYESGIGAMWEHETFWNRDSENSVETEDYRDPVKHCEVYKKQGCSHVDGIGCNMNNCLIRKQKYE